MLPYQSNFGLEAQENGPYIKNTSLFFCVYQVEGKEAPGPLFDFGLLVFHCGKILFENKSGPFFYLSKVAQTHTHLLKPICVM